MTTHRWLLPIVLFIPVLLLLGAGQAPPQPQQRPPGGPSPAPREFPKPDTVLIKKSLEYLNKAIEGKTDSPAVSVFENIKVFKKMPAGRLLGMMRNWTRILGVDCAHCHVPEHWEKDDKAPKLTARDMDKMEDDVNDLIKNVKSIKNERAHIACWTCHRGQPVPEAFPFRGGPPPGPPPQGK